MKAPSGAAAREWSFTTGSLKRRSDTPGKTYLRLLKDNKSFRGKVSNIAQIRGARESQFHPLVSVCENTDKGLELRVTRASYRVRCSDSAILRNQPYFQGLSIENPSGSKLAETEVN